MLCKPGSIPKFHMKISRSIYYSKGRNLSICWRTSYCWDCQVRSLFKTCLKMIKFINNLNKNTNFRLMSFKNKIVHCKIRQKSNKQLSEIRRECYLKSPWKMMELSELTHTSNQVQPLKRRWNVMSRFVSLPH